MYQTAIPGFLIREATRDDCGLILKFIRDLAKYEKLSHEVVATESDLRRYLFEEQTYAEVLIGEQAGRSVGFALFFHNFSTFLGRPGIYLEDLFVNPQDRGQGYGKALLGCLARIAVQRDCGRLEWSVLDWNRPAIDFYRGLGATVMDGWTVHRLAGPALRQLANQFEVPA
jgi:GNAT superfamily N-acetyltransferase